MTKINSDDRQTPEIWDAYYADGTLAGCDLIRGKKIPDGLKHLVAEVFVMHQDGSILVMRRDLKKPNYPGFWESSAGGSVLKGECALDGAKRELFEETGIAAESDRSLKHLYHIVTDTAIHQGYLYITDTPKEAIRLQQGETIAFRWVDRETFLKIFYSHQYVDGLMERQRQFVEQDFRIPITITAITSSDELWEQVITFARNCSWRAGKSLSEDMSRHIFTDWERVIVALNGGRIAGYCTVSRKDCIPDVPYTPYIGYLFVEENYRGCRLSQRLISYAMSYLKTLGFYHVFLVSDHVNLYEKYGFQVIDKKLAPWGEIEKIYRQDL